MHRGACLELYYCNMVEWFWWDSNLILTTNRIPSVLWHCWFGHLACKNRLRNDLLCVEWDVKPYTLAHSLYKSEYFSDQMTFWVLSSLYCRTICLISLSDVFDLKNPQRASHVMLSTGIIPLYWSWWDHPLGLLSYDVLLLIRYVTLRTRLSTIGDRSFRVTVARAWNSLPIPASQH